MSGTFADRHADLLDRLDPVQRRAVVQAAANAILEGWDPTPEDVELQVRAAASDITHEEFMQEVLATARSRHVWA